MNRKNFFTLVIMIAVLSACSSKQTLEPWETEVQKNPISIGYIGEKPSIEVEGVSFVPFQVKNHKEYGSLWVDEKEFINFSSKEDIVTVKEMLNDGKVVVFLTVENAYDKIAPELGIKGYEESKGGNSVQHGFYIWDENGQARIGFILGNKNGKSLRTFLEYTLKYRNSQQN